VNNGLVIKDDSEMANSHEYLTVKEAAAIARMHPDSLWRIIRTAPRRAPPFGRIRRTIRIPTAKFHEWMERRK